MQGIEHMTRRPIETSLGDGVDRTQGSCVANALYAFGSIKINNACSTQCRVVNMQSDDSVRHH